MSRRRGRSSSSDEGLDSFHISAFERGDTGLLDDEDGHDVFLGSRLEEELNCSIEKMREEEAVPIARLIRLEGSLGSSSQGSSNNSPHPMVMESAAAHLSGTLELLEDVEMPSLSLCESAELVSLVSISPNSPLKLGFSFKDDGPANGSFMANEHRGNVYSVSSSNYRNLPPAEEFDIADKIAMLSAMPSTSPSVNTLITFDEKETSQNVTRRMTLDQTKSFSGAFLAEACGIVEELDGLAANMTSSPLGSPERRVSPDRRMTLGPDMDLLDVENMNDSLLSSLAIANSPVKKPALSAVPSPLPGHEVKDKALPVPVKAVDCTYDRLAQLLNETQDIVSGPAAAALGRTGDVKPGAVNSTFLQSNNQKLLNSTFDGEQPPAQKLANNPNANATFDHKHMIAATNKTFDRLEHQMAANTTFEMADNNLINTTFDRKENQQANTTFDFQAGTEAKNENLNITFEKGEYRIPSMNETVNLMDAEGDVLKLILDSTPKKSSKAAPEAASTPKGAAKPQIASKGTITKDPTQSFLHRMSLNLRNEQVKAAVPESSQQPVAEPHSHTQAPSNKNAVPGFKMGHLDQQAMSTQLRRLHNGPTAVRSTSGPMRALPMHAFPLHQSCGKQVENAISPDDEGITALDYNTPTESSIKDAKPTFGSISSIENERPCTPDIGIAMDHRTSTPDVFRPGDPGSGPRITSTPAMRGGVFSRMVGMDGPAPTPIIAPIPRLQRVVSIASTGSLPESCQDPQWPGLSHDSTKDSKGGIGTPANHHSGRAIQAVKLNHRSGVNLMADSNEVDIQDKKSEPLLQNEDFDKVIPSLDTGKEVEEEEIVDSQRLIQDGDKQGAINKQFPAAQGNSQQACDGLPGETVRRKEVTKDLKKDCQEILNRTLDLQPSTDVNVDGSQATNNENEINVEEPDVLVEKMPSGNVHQSEFRNNTTKPLVDHEVRADCEKQIDTAVITKSQSSSSIEVKANYEASDACEPDLPININKKNPTLSIVPQVIQSIQTEVCLNDTFEAEQSDSSAKIKTEDYHIQKDNIPVDKNNLPEGPGKDICAESKVNNSQAEKPRPKRNKSAESNESSNNEGESHTSSEMNAEPNRQTKLKRSSLTHARKVPTPVSSTKPNLKTTKKLDTSKSSTYSNTSFSKTDQKTSMKKVGGQSSRPTATNNKNPQAMARPALGIRRSLPHSSPSQKSNNSITKSNKENTLGKQVDGNIKQPETQIKSKLSLTKGINPPKRTVLGSSNIQIRKSIVVQPEKQKNGLAFTKNSPLRANTGALKNKDPGESLKVRTKSVQSNSTYGQDKDNKTTSQIRLKPLSKRMKPSSPHKSPSKAELKQPQKLPQPTQKIAVASHTLGFTNKLARPQMASGLQTPAAQSKITSSGNSAVSKLPGLRPLSNIKPVAVKRVSGIMPPTTNKPNVLRPPRPMAR